MNWTVEYSRDKGFVTVVTSGEFTIGDHARMVEDITSREFWKPGSDVLFDHRSLDFCETTMMLLRKAAENHERRDDRIGDGKAALVMKSTADFGRGRQFELLASGKVSAKLRVFMDEKSACDWLLEKEV